MHFSKTIRTKNFNVKTLSEHDVTTRYLSWINDEMAQKYITHKESFATLESLIKYVRKKVEGEDSLFFGIFTHDDVHIGNIKYEPIDFKNKYAVMGILIGDTSFRGKNVAGEVIEATASLLRDCFKIEEILLGVDKQNHSAIRAYSKIGFQKKQSLYFRIDGVSMILNTHVLKAEYLLETNS